MNGALSTRLPASGIARVPETPVVVFSSDREPCRRALSPKRGRGGTFYPTITKRDQLGGDLLRDGAQRLPCVRLLHVPKHGETDEQDVAKNVRGLAHVCS